MFAMKCMCLLNYFFFIAGSTEVFLPPERVPIFGTTMPDHENVLCAQLQWFHLPTIRNYGLHSWYAENCYEKSAFLCKRSKWGALVKLSMVVLEMVLHFDL